MLEKLKKLFWVIVFFFYALIFRKKPGPVTRNFIKGLGFVFSGLMLSKVFSLLFQIMSGRLLGRIEYGRFALVCSISNILWTFMYLSIGTAMVKYFTSTRSERDKAKILSTSVILMAVSTIIFALLFYLLSVPLATAFSINLPYMFAAIVMAVGMNIWTLAQKVCQGMNKMKKLGALNVVWSLSVLIISIILYLYTRTAIIPIISVIIGYLLAAAPTWPDIRKYLRPVLSRKWSKILMKYSLIAILGTISLSTIGALNKIFLNIFLSIGDVGMYQAYYYSTLTVASFFVTGFVMVFFPISSMYRKKAIIFSQMNKLLKFSPIFYILLFVMSSIVLFLYGSDYTFIIPMLLLFVFAGLITSVHLLYIWFAASFGIRGVKISSLSVGIICIANIITALLLIPSYGLYGAILSMIISYTIGTLYIYFRIRSVFSPEEEGFIE